MRRPTSSSASKFLLKKKKALLLALLIGRLDEEADVLSDVLDEADELVSK
jgi:hypothetical protein